MNAMNEKNPQESISPSGLTRRSFIKRSVVAAVAVSSMTIFSGLVRASKDYQPEEEDPSCAYSSWTKKWHEEDGVCYIIHVIDECHGRPGNWRTRSRECVVNCKNGDPQMEEASEDDLNRKTCR
jgi:anaerobic selenocysteine-containing dehydrogenase